MVNPTESAETQNYGPSCMSTQGHGLQCPSPGTTEFLLAPSSPLVPANLLCDLLCPRVRAPGSLRGLPGWLLSHLVASSEPFQGQVPLPGSAGSLTYLGGGSRLSLLSLPFPVLAERLPVSAWSSAFSPPLQHALSLGSSFPCPFAKQGCNPIYKVRQGPDFLCKCSLCSPLPVLVAAYCPVALDTCGWCGDIPIPCGRCIK